MSKKIVIESQPTPVGKVRPSEPASRTFSDFEGGFPTKPEVGISEYARSGQTKDYSHLKMKDDHECRPLWIAQDNLILLEAFSPLYKVATDFLIAIAEPISRPVHIHEYVLTKYSIYAAASVGLSDIEIIQVLDRFSKNKEIPSEVREFIQHHAQSYGKAKLVLKRNQYFIETSDKETMDRLKKFECIQKGIQHQKEFEYQQQRDRTQASERNGGISQAALDNLTERQQKIRMEQGGFQLGIVREDHRQQVQQLQNLQKEFQVLLDVEMSEEEVEDKAFSTAVLSDIIKKKGSKTFEVQVHNKDIEAIKQHCEQQNLPLIEEYDFKKDRSTPDLSIDIKSTTIIRDYQEQSLSKMFSNGRARSGIIVLPCGAGKTLTGILAASHIKKSTLVLCNTNVSVEQWRKQFCQWATLSKLPVRYTSKDTKDVMFDGLKEAGIVVSTYSKISQAGKKCYEQSNEQFDKIREIDWGLVILDEVQVVPAQTFRQVISLIKSHCKLGLTATLVREDELIRELNFLIGPKLYEANWQDLQNQGYLAKVQCIEVQCEMTPDFYTEYLKGQKAQREMFYVCNPNKFLACQYLVDLHEERGDKIIVFSDKIFAQEFLSRSMKKAFINGNCSHNERMNILEAFQKTNIINTIFISKIGDTSIDLPVANVIIQISSHYGSRRQEAQRLGRILRPKQEVSKQAISNSNDFNAFFYTLVSTDTQEMYYAEKRQQFLVDQGYFFQVVKEMPYIKHPQILKGFKMTEKQEQNRLLQEIMKNEQSKSNGRDKQDDEDEESDDAMQYLEMERAKERPKQLYRN